MHGTLALSDGGVGMSLVTCDDVGAALAAAALGDRDGRAPTHLRAARRGGLPPPASPADGAPGWLVEA